MDFDVTKAGALKEAFLAGFDAGSEDCIDGGRIIDDDFYIEVTEKAFKEWCVRLQAG